MAHLVYFQLWGQSLLQRLATLPTALPFAQPLCLAIAVGLGQTRASLCQQPIEGSAPQNSPHFDLRMNSTTTQNHYLRRNMGRVYIYFLNALYTHSGCNGKHLPESGHGGQMFVLKRGLFLYPRKANMALTKIEDPKRCWVFFLVSLKSSPERGGKTRNDCWT